MLVSFLDVFGLALLLELDLSPRGMVLSLIVCVLPNPATRIRAPGSGEPAVARHEEWMRG